MKVSIRYIHENTFTGEIDAVEYSHKQNLVILWCGNRKIELCHFKGTGDDWVHMDVMFKGRMVEFRNDDDGYTLPVDYLKTYSDPALEARFVRHMRSTQYLKDILHDKDITATAALGKILTDLFLKG